MKEYFNSESDIFKLLSEPPKMQGGKEKYRPYLMAYEYLKRKEKEEIEYKQRIVAQIDPMIEKWQEKISQIRQVIDWMIKEDQSIDVSEEGTRSVKLPDIGNVSLSKPMRRLVIRDATKVLEQLGKEYERVTIELDKVKAKKRIEELLEEGKRVEGIDLVEGEQQLRIEI